MDWKTLTARVDFSSPTDSDFSIAFVLGHLDLPWDWSVLSSHPFLSFDFVVGHCNLPWRWKQMRRHAFIREVLAYCSVPFDKFSTPALKEHMVRAIARHPELSFYFKYLSTRWDLSLELVGKFHREKWDWYGNFG